MEKNEELQTYKEKIKEPKHFVPENQISNLEELSHLVEAYQKKRNLNSEFRKFKENSQGIREELGNLKEAIAMGKKKYKAMKEEYDKDIDSIQKEKVQFPINLRHFTRK